MNGGILGDMHSTCLFELVIREARGGDKGAAKKRLDLLKKIPLLELSEEALYLAGELVRNGLVPERAKEDALHIALATVHGMDYILTWNCRHIANAEMRRGIILMCIALGYETPVVSTPEELLGD
jgi:hypothetical protein